MYGHPDTAIIMPMVSVFCRQIGWIIRTEITAASSANFESANRAAYFPIIIPAACIVRRVWWANGATTTGGATVEAGVYADAGYGPGAKLVSGSATQGTAAEVQFVDVTDTTLTPGLYWLAIVASTATNTTFFVRTAAGPAEGLRFQEASASPLPSTATPVESTGSQIYVFGFATTASP